MVEHVKVVVDRYASYRYLLIKFLIRKISISMLNGSSVWQC